MKTIKLILLTLLISSCSKSWVCTTVMTSETINTSFTTEFKGTTAEAQTIEDETTYVTPMFSGDDINQVTTCLKK